MSVSNQSSHASVEERLLGVLRDVFGIALDSLGATARLDEIAPLDSLSLAELASALDREFDVEVPGEEFTTSLSFGELVGIVRAARGASG